MRTIWLIFGLLLAGLLAVRLWPKAGPPAAAGPAPLAAPAAVLVAERHPAAGPTAPAAAAGQRDSLVRFALRQLRTPYLYAGTSPRTGFDCSGFLLYVYGHFGVATPHSTALLIDAGQPVARAEAQPGDLVVFTGTAATSTTPGHAGIVISAPGEVPLRFVHASSARREPFVKISQVEGTDYERRFMQVRRVLGAASPTRPAAPLATRPPLAAAPAASRPAATPAVAPLLPARPHLALPAAPALPAKLATVRVRRPARLWPAAAARAGTHRRAAPKPAARPKAKASPAKTSAPKTAARKPALKTIKRRATLPRAPKSR